MPQERVFLRRHALFKPYFDQKSDGTRLAYVTAELNRAQR
jgi:hypothetical protein